MPKRKKPTKPLSEYIASSPFVRQAAGEACFPVFRGMNCYLCFSNYKSAGHHIIPRSASSYFLHHICNIVPLCRNCHASVTNQDPSKYELLARIRKEEREWAEWIDDAVVLKREVVRVGIKPDYYAAVLFWRAHEDSGLTIADRRAIVLCDWPAVKARLEEEIRMRDPAALDEKIKELEDIS